MTADHNFTISAVVHRTPEWIRHDLGSKDPSIRSRAEEALAAMIAAALKADM